MLTIVQKRCTLLVVAALSLIAACRSGDLVIPSPPPTPVSPISPTQPSPQPLPAPTPQPDISGWGDSMTGGPGEPGAYPADLQQLLVRPVHALGVGGQTSVQILARIVADTARRHDVAILWMGRNDTSVPVQVTTSVAGAVATLGLEHTVVLSIASGAIDGYVNSGSNAYDSLVVLNHRLAAAYPGHFLDMFTILIEAYDPAQPQDVLDHQHGITPTSLRKDGLHLNAAGNIVVANAIAAFLKAKGW
jgi:lysophospholipase L1-like esterase